MSSAAGTVKSSGISDEGLSRWGFRFCVVHFICSLAAPNAAVTIFAACALLGMYGTVSYKREALFVHAWSIPAVWISVIVHSTLQGLYTDPAWIVYGVILSIFSFLSALYSFLLRRRLPQENRILELQDESWL
eukprot:ANDGO_04128.mRNA.1 hypothetical protein